MFPLINGTSLIHVNGFFVTIRNTALIRIYFKPMSIKSLPHCLDSIFSLNSCCNKQFIYYPDFCLLSSIWSYAHLMLCECLISHTVTEKFESPVKLVTCEYKTNGVIRYLFHFTFGDRIHKVEVINSPKTFKSSWSPTFKFQPALNEMHQCRKFGMCIWISF